MRITAAAAAAVQLCITHVRTEDRTQPTNRCALDAAPAMRGSALVARAGCTSSAPAATTRDGEIHFTASAATLTCQLHSATIYTYTLIDALGSGDVMTIAAITIVHSAAAAADTQCSVA